MASKIDSVLADLKSKKKSTKCSGRRGLVKMLTSLGFDIVNSGTAGHKVFNHPQISDFTGANFDCGHPKGKRAQGMAIKQPYIIDVIRVLEEYQDELEKLEKEGKI